jgi:NAD(P)-dependent dehydrogenase (short-subunit alcohol dehydrogenase family)
VWYAKPGSKAELVPGNIGSPEQCQAIVQRAMGSFRRVDVAVNNAAYQMAHERITDIPPQEIEQTLRTNMDSRAAGPR